MWGLLVSNFDTVEKIPTGPIWYHKMSKEAALNGIRVIHVPFYMHLKSSKNRDSAQMFTDFEKSSKNAIDVWGNGLFNIAFRHHF